MLLRELMSSVNRDWSSTVNAALTEPFRNFNVGICAGGSFNLIVTGRCFVWRRGSSRIVLRLLIVCCIFSARIL